MVAGQGADCKKWVGDHSAAPAQPLLIPPAAGMLEERRCCTEAAVLDRAACCDLGIGGSDGRRYSLRARTARSAPADD